jgi:esterase
MSEIRVNGVSLYYEERGAGVPIVCIHGTGSSAAFWTDSADELARHGRAIVYDRRGCFRSERPQPYATSVRQQTDDAAALLAALRAAPAIVNGRATPARSRSTSRSATRTSSARSCCSSPATSGCR